MSVSQPQDPTPTLINRKFPLPEDANTQAYKSYSYKSMRANHWNKTAEAAQTFNTDRDLEIDRSGTLYKYAVFSKTMPHNSKGEVLKSTWDAMLADLRAGNTLASVPKGSTGKFVNPQAAYSYVPMGSDPCALNITVPPTFTSRTMAAEMAEVYEQALNRDTAFSVIESMTANTAADRAVSVLNSFGSDFLGNKIGGVVTRKSLFRGTAMGCELGPYVSQFLYQDIPYGALNIVQKYNTETGTPHGTTVSGYLDIQNGDAFDPDADLSGTFNYIHTPRVLGSYVHRDAVYQAYLNAALILLGTGAAFDPNNPYLTNDREESFVTHNVADILPLVANVSALAFRTAWAQKWGYHLRLRPEVMGCRVHHQEIGDTDYGIHADLIGSATITAVKAFNASSTSLLPLQYPEGSPAHPSYPAGHAVVAGACATVLKAFFDESVSIPSLMTVNHSVDGSSVAAYGGSTTGMTVGTELNKLAANIAIGRDWAGVHYRSDGDYGMALGEKVAISFLEDVAVGYPETFSGFNLTKFDGTSIIIT
jgi:hypothetical protein